MRCMQTRLRMASTVQFDLRAVVQGQRASCSGDVGRQDRLQVEACWQSVGHGSLRQQAHVGAIVGDRPFPLGTVRGKIGAAVRLHSLHVDGAVAAHLQGDPAVRQRVVRGVEIGNDLMPPFRIRFRQPWGGVMQDGARRSRLDRQLQFHLAVGLAAEGHVGRTRHKCCCVRGPLHSRVDRPQPMLTPCKVRPAAGLPPGS